MPGLTEADTIRILVATDSHVGVHERDPVRGDDSWKTFHEVMYLAKERDVDMVLLAGDLFHENKPSRKSMYQVMRSLRMNCFGDKPCELEMLSDGSEIFQGAFPHANYEDMDINVAIPVFSIHGNHDDPSGEGHFAALDVLQVSGLINYYGRTPESDNICIKPVLLQKGGTKLALYGMSNVRDERLFRTFRNKNVKFFQPGTQKTDWFNLMSVHQNHHAHTETSYLPENFLPDFLDLVVWGHEHECLIDPRYNPETNFHVMQPGSSVATSLVPGEAVPKHVAILSITGRDFVTENIRLKTVRPFVMREIVLADDKEACKIAKNSRTDDQGRSALTRYLMTIVDELIDEAQADWLEAQESRSNHSDLEDDQETPLPLVRLRVETSDPPAGGIFDTENPQRFSNRFVGKVANISDVVQFYKKKRTATTGTRKGLGAAEMPDSSLTEQIDSVKIEKLVREFLAAQSLTILPQNTFGDAVSQFVDKDDKHAMEMFVNESLANQIKHLMALDRVGNGDEEDDEAQESLQAAMDKYRSQLEDMFSTGSLRGSRKRKLKPKPDTWDSDLDGTWEDQPGALIHTDDEDNVDEDEDDDDDDQPIRPPATRGRGRGRGAARGARGGAASRAAPASARKSVTAKKPAPAKPTTRGKKRVSSSSHISDEDSDVKIVDSHEDEDESQGLFVKQSQSQPPRRPTRAAASPAKKQPARGAAAKTRQSTLAFGSQSQASQSQAGKGRGSVEDISDDDDDEDAFEPVAKTTPMIRGRRLM